MSLSLPQDLEPYCEDYDDLHASGAYALELERPTDLEHEWHQHYEEKPPYWSDLLAGSKCIYVGGATDLLARLETHRNNDDPEKKSKREPALLKVCRIRGLHTAWVCESEDEAWRNERALARMLQRTRPEWFTHQR